MLNALSIRWKFIFLAGLCLICVAAIILATNVIQNNNGNKLLATTSRDMLTDEIKNNLLAKGSQKGAELQSLFGGAALLAESLSTQALQTRQAFERSAISSQTLREHLTKTLEATLEATPWALGVFIIFDENALDGKDMGYKNNLDLGSNEEGRYSTYWSRFTGSPKQTPILESDIAKGEIQENGAPYNSWFMCSRNSGKECILAPYSDEEAGHWVLMTTVTSPIKVDGKTIGVVGVDISLETLQENAVHTQSSMFGGNGKVTIFSNSGIIAANSNASETLGKKLETDHSFDGQNLIEAAKQAAPQIITNNDTIKSVTPVKPIGGDINWGVSIEAPKSILLSNVQKLQETLQATQQHATSQSIIFAGFAVVVGLLLIWLSATRITSSINETANMLKSMSSGDGDLTQRIKYYRKDELGELISWFNHFLEKLQPIISEVIANTRESNSVARKSSLASEAINEGMQIQFREIELVATASTEMSASSQEVAANAAHAAKAAEEADKAAREGSIIVQRSNDQMIEFASQLESAVVEVEQLEQNSELIGKVLDVIRGIAEQTNLLALNAAIEAARAGETGRGFAVVADEVRNLARRTQDSVEEIRQVIEGLQFSARNVVLTMHQNQKNATMTGENIALTTSSLLGIRQAVSVISNLNLQIATAAEEQSSVAEAVNRNVAAIKDISEKLTSKTDESATLSQTLNRLSTEQLGLAGQFKV